MFFKRRTDLLASLKAVPLFRNLSQQHLELIARHTDELQQDAGSVLIHQGRAGREFILVVDGTVRIERDGREIAKRSAGATLGELALIDGKPRSATVIAETPTTLLVMERRSFLLLMDEVPALRKKIVETLCERLREQEDHHLD